MTDARKRTMPLTGVARAFAPRRGAADAPPRRRPFPRSAQGKRASLGVAGLMLVTLLAPPALGREDTARITLQKLGAPRKTVRLYTVKKGDWIHNILRRENLRGARTYTLLKRLNPGIRNLNRIYPGQVLRLPGPVETPEILAAASPPAAMERPSTRFSAEESTALAPEAQIAFLRHAILGMQGSIVTEGRYYLPLPHTGQVAIDCTRMPVVELNDGTTSILDWGGRLPDKLARTIHAYWKSHRVLSVSHRDDPVAILRRVVAASRSYAMVQRGKPLPVGETPAVHIACDWLIIPREASPPAPWRYGIIQADDPSRLLPRGIRNYAEKNGLGLTEHVGYAVAAAPPSETPPPAIPAIPKAAGAELAHAVLTFLGHTPTRGTEVTFFGEPKNGFLLSLQADVAVRIGDRQLVFHGRPLPEALQEMLREIGQVCILPEGEARETTLAKIFQALGMAHEQGRFRFPLLDRVPSRGYVEFPALRVQTEGQGLYFVDFDPDPDVYGFLAAAGKGRIVRY